MSKSYSTEEFALKVIAAIAKGQYGVKVKSDGSVLLDVGGFMQNDGSIGKYQDENLNLDSFKEFLI